LDCHLRHSQTHLPRHGVAASVDGNCVRIGHARGLSHSFRGDASGPEKGHSDGAWKQPCSGAMGSLRSCNAATGSDEMVAGHPRRVMRFERAPLSISRALSAT
jgi:hypothetical protein